MEAAWYLCLSSRLPFLVTWPLGITGGSLGGGGGKTPPPSVLSPGAEGTCKKSRGPLPSPCLRNWGSQELGGR